MLTNRVFLIRERVQFMKLVAEYDILDPASGGALGTATETISGTLKFFRLLLKKHMLPTTLTVRAADGRTELTLRKGFSFFRSHIAVSSGAGRPLGTLRSKVFSLGGGFFILSPGGRQVAELKGDWKGWNFTLLDPNGRELGKVTKQWAGIGKELFTTADNYMVALDGLTDQTAQLAGLLLGAGLAVDMVFKEQK